MTNRIERPAKEFPVLCATLGYRKRKVIVVATTSVVLSNLNWCGGTRSQYHMLDVAQDAVKTMGQLNVPHPMDNEAEGARIRIRPGTAIVETGVFQGETMKMRIYVHPDNMPQVIPA